MPIIVLHFGSTHNQDFVLWFCYMLKLKSSAAQCGVRKPRCSCSVPGLIGGRWSAKTSHSHPESLRSCWINSGFEQALLEQKAAQHSAFHCPCFQNFWLRKKSTMSKPCWSSEMEMCVFRKTPKVSPLQTGAAKVEKTLLGGYFYPSKQRFITWFNTLSGREWKLPPNIIMYRDQVCRQHFNRIVVVFCFVLFVCFFLLVLTYMWLWEKNIYKRYWLFVNMFLQV